MKILKTISIVLIVLLVGCKNDDDKSDEVVGGQVCVDFGAGTGGGDFLIGNWQLIEFADSVRGCVTTECKKRSTISFTETEITGTEFFVDGDLCDEEAERNETYEVEGNKIVSKIVLFEIGNGSVPQNTTFTATSDTLKIIYVYESDSNEIGTVTEVYEFEKI